MSSATAPLPATPRTEEEHSAGFSVPDNVTSSSHTPDSEEAELEMPTSPSSTPSRPLPQSQDDTPSTRALPARAVNLDPKVKQLADLFPDTEPEIISAVLAAHYGSVEGAMESLLSMNDERYAQAPPSQVDTDAQLARQLQEEDRRQASAPAPQPPTSPQPLTYKPYVPKSRAGARSSGPPATYQPGQQAQQSSLPTAPDGERPRDELDQLTEGFTQLAAKGKQTLGGLFSKVKEQINKMDGVAQPEAQSSASYEQSTSSPSWSTPSTLPRPSAQPTRSSSTGVVPDILPRPKPNPPAPASPPLPAAPAAPGVLPPSTVVSAPSTSGTSAPTSITPPATSEEPKKDFSKIGLLPRQSIALEQKQKSGNESDDSEDLEYVRSPFDDD